jgi:hypothetical protein
VVPSISRPGGTPQPRASQYRAMHPLKQAWRISHWVVAEPGAVSAEMVINVPLKPTISSLKSDEVGTRFSAFRHWRRSRKQLIINGLNASVQGPAWGNRR